jgi:Leucine-rich repeat (LRR) protein
LNLLLRLNLAHNRIKQIDFEASLGQLHSLEFLDLSHNKITERPKGNLSCSNLTVLDLSNNRIKRFFLDQFWNFSKNNLTISLEENKIESVDFRDLTYEETSEPRTNLVVEVGSKITCNCHTMSLYNFTTKRLEMDSKIYNFIKVLPTNIECNKNSYDTLKYVIDIKKEDVTCPLDSPHQIFCPKHCLCDRRPYDGFLIVKCYNISVVPLMPRFKALRDIRLDRIELNIKTTGVSNLPSKRRDHNYNDVTKIHASHNHILTISVDNIPDRLEYLDLKHNRLSHIRSDVIEKFTKLSTLHLSSNPWDCETAKDLVRFVKTHREIEKDFNLVKCSGKEYFLEIELENQCENFVTMWIAFIGVILGIVISIIYYFNRATIIEWIFTHDKQHLIEKTFDLIKLFDGIVCVANNDKIFGKYIAAKLLERPNQYKISMVIKDWNARDPIPKNILKGFRNSRRVIVILSDYFEVIYLIIVFEIRSSMFTHL